MTDATAPRRARWWVRRRRELEALVLTLPSWGFLAALFAVPIVVAAYLSMRNDSLTSFVPGTFVGLDNFRKELSSPTFWEALTTTLVIMGLGLAIQLPTGVGLAVVLHREMRGSRFFRSTLLIPMLLTPVAVGMMWRFMFDSDLGVIRWTLGHVGLGKIDWLGSTWPARIAVVIVDSWQSIPFVMLLTLAGLAGLSSGPHEAAAVDGASRWQIFRLITLPMLRPVLYVILMIRVVDTFKIFDIIFIMTRGGPGTATQTLGMLNYNTGFNFLATSRAAALSIVLAVITIPTYILWMRATKANR